VWHVRYVNKLYILNLFDSLMAIHRLQLTLALLKPDVIANPLIVEVGFKNKKWLVNNSVCLVSVCECPSVRRVSLKDDRTWLIAWFPLTVLDVDETMLGLGLTLTSSQTHQLRAPFWVVKHSTLTVLFACSVNTIDWRCVSYLRYGKLCVRSRPVIF